MKNVLGIYSAPPRHWVGDGFPVRSLFSWQSHGGHVSPFLLLDHAGPMDFEPARTPRGVGEHPHRGFETVTIVYAGEVEHRDSTGAGGVIGPGDVQWMTAGRGILHEEFHSEAFTGRGGTLEMAQLWVNLPAADKMAEPGYQSLTAADIPEVALPADAGTLRVIAGDFADHQGPARTHTPMHVWDLRLAQGGSTRLHLPAGWNTTIAVLHGNVRFNGSHDAHDGQVALFDRDDTDVVIDAASDAVVLLLAGEPIDEPIAARGPFVMNTDAEIRQAMKDFGAGRFGSLAG